MRLLLRLLVIAALVGVAVFFGYHPGRVRIVWQGWQIDTSVGVLAAAAVLVALAVLALVSALSFAFGLPGRLRRRRREKRRRAGYLALTRGMVAVAAGDAQEARRHARKADLLLAEPPLTLLLSAQAAQLDGDEAAAQKFFTAMLDRPEIEFLGLRGLFNQAQRAGDQDTALRLAERAQALRPDTPWVVESLVDLRARAGQWEEARAALAEAVKRRLFAPATARRHEGVILHALSLAAERRSDRKGAAALAAKAQALTPDLAPPACHHARLLIALDRPRAARKAIERAWRAAPHPDLARLYGSLQEDEPLARFAGLQRLAALDAGARESHLALAETAVAARLWGEAHHHLDCARQAPPGDTARLCLIEARLVEAEPGRQGEVREWLDRALRAPPDSCYVCGDCGRESLDWQPLCPNCGGFDRLAWRTPTRALQIAEAPIATDPAAAPPPLPDPLRPPLPIASR